MGLRGFQTGPCQAPADLPLGKVLTADKGPAHPRLLSPRPLCIGSSLLLAFLIRFLLNGGSGTNILETLVRCNKARVRNQSTSVVSAVMQQLLGQATFLSGLGNLRNHRLWGAPENKKGWQP